MKKCTYCNKTFDDSVTYCPECGSKLEDDVQFTSNTQTNDSYAYYDQSAMQQNMNANAEAKKEDAGSWGFGILSFLFPIVGFILFFVWRKEFPKKAKSCGIPALVSFLINIVSSVICMVFYYSLLVGQMQ